MKLDIGIRVRTNRGFDSKIGKDLDIDKRTLDFTKKIVVSFLDSKDNTLRSYVMVIGEPQWEMDRDEIKSLDLPKV